MRICIVTPGFSASEEDWCIPAVWDLVRGLAAEHEVTVFSLRYPRQKTSYRVHGARVVALGGGQVRGLRRIPFLLDAWRRLHREAKRSRFDIVHALWAHEPGCLSALVARRLGIPLLVSLMGGELASYPDISYGGQTENVNRRLVRFALARADLVSCGSRFLDRLAEAQVPSKRRKVLPLGVDSNRFSSGSETVTLVGEPCLLRVGSLVAVKDPLTLLGAFVRVGSRLPEAHLHFVGEGSMKDAMMKTIEELGLSSRVHLHGAVQHDLLPAYYRAADLSVSSSRFESQAMVVLEAGACGTATVGTAVGSLRELAPIELRCPPGDEDALAQAIERGLDDATSYGREMQSRVLERYGLERTNSDWSATYRQLQSRRSPTTRE